MSVIRRLNDVDCYEVDFSIPPTLLIKNDEPIPVKEFLKTLASKNNIF
jgi:hypothetical protein